MAVRLNHTIVAAHDYEASSKFLTEILGLPPPLRLGPFAIVTVGDTSLDYMNVKEYRGKDGEIVSQHYAFLVTEAEFDRIYDVNVKAIYLAALACVPEMEKRGGGVIINTASTAGVRPRPGLTWYNGSKGAAIILTKSMAAELAPKKIRVNAINPVIGETGMLEQFMGMPDTPENRAKFLATIPLGRMSRPSDIANAALFFADPASEFITGVAMEVDGGRCV